MERNIYIQNMPLEQAQGLFIEHLQKNGFFNLETEIVDTHNSLGRITSQPVVSQRSCPHYMCSAMDGIAVKAALTFGATETNPIKIMNKDFLEVDTGDYIPAEFDAVVMIEDVNFENDGATVIKTAVPWQHIRSIGEDLVAEDMIVPSRYLIGPYELAAFVTAAVQQVAVVKQPVVGIIPTGTELVDAGAADMPAGAIVESNSRMLAGLCQQWGARPVRHNIVIDDRQLIKEAILSIKDNTDMIVVCSGSSAGREDFTAGIIEELGELIVHGIATRPGKPAILGMIDKKPVIGVPGYPISANLVFNLFARPVIYRKQGLQPPQAPTVKCTVSRKLASSMGVDEFVNANVGRIGERLIAYPLNRGAGITTSLVKADGEIHIERGHEGLTAGQECTVRLQHPRSLIDKTLITIGSHDMALDILADIMQKKYDLRLVSTNTGSMGGIMALRRQETHFSGIHLLDLENGTYNVSYLHKYLPGQKLLLVNLTKRQQGLMVKPGNPCNIKNIQDLTNPDIRFINRQKGAGTRILLDYLLAGQKINPATINGYNREEYTHLAVAAAVKNDGADTGLGIYSSAKALGLDFIPITEEQYDLCILPDTLSAERLDCLLQAIKSDEFRRRVLAMGGYNLEISGQVIHSR